MYLHYITREVIIMINRIRNFLFNESTVQEQFTVLCKCLFFHLFFSRVGEYSAAQMFCSLLVSGLQICTGALVIWWEQLLKYILHFSYTFSFVVGIVLYTWWL